MRKTLSYAIAACVAAGSFAAPAMGDSLTVKVKPNYPVVKKVVVRREPCYYKTVKTVTNRKTVVVKKRICP